MIVVEDGTGLANANSYVDPAGAVATAYFTGHLYAATWNTSSGPQREAAVIQATRTLDASVAWNGRASSQTQALEWPRCDLLWRSRPVYPPLMPYPVANATLELALALLTRDRTSDTANTSPLDKLSLGGGALELDFGDSPNVTVKALPDIVADLVKDLAGRVDSGTRMARVYRA